MSPRTANLAIVLFLVALMAAVSLTAPRWARFLRQPLPNPEDEAPAAAASPTPSPSGALVSETPEAKRTINVRLFFEAKDRLGLLMEERTVPFSSDLALQLRAVLEELIHGPESPVAVSPLAPETQVKDVFVTNRGVAYVDLSGDVVKSHEGGSAAELVTVYSIVDSITVNFPAIKRVQILVDDRPVATLAGHVDLSRPLRPDLTLLAAVAEPATEPAPTPAPSPRS